jgi:membrane protein YdbS with pleckstrin-like domain
MDAVFDVPGAPWVGASPALGSVRRIALVATTAVLAVLVVLVWMLLLREPLGWPVLAGALLLLLAAAGVAWVAVARNATSWAWAERDADLFVRHGILVRRLEVVPYGRMQLVEVTAGPLQRRAGIATLTLHTAAPGSDARILGVPATEASRLRDRLTSLGEAQAAGL